MDPTKLDANRVVVDAERTVVRRCGVCVDISQKDSHFSHFSLLFISGYLAKCQDEKYSEIDIA